MRHDQRQRVLMPGPDEDEVDLHPVDRGRELWQRVQSCLELAPVVLGRPVAGELTHRRQLHALRRILDKLLGRQAGRHDAPAEVGECLFRNVGAEGADFDIGHGVLGHGFPNHGDLLVPMLCFDPRHEDIGPKPNA
jgi:hypothetical protein